MLGLAAIALSIYVCYRFADTIVAVLGKRGTDVVMRLSAFILLCIGIQIIWTGYSSLVHPKGAPLTPSPAARRDRRAGADAWRAGTMSLATTSA